MKAGLLFPLPPRSWAPNPLAELFSEILANTEPHWDDNPDVRAWGNFGYETVLEMRVWEAMPSKHKKVRQVMSASIAEDLGAYDSVVRSMFAMTLSQPALAVYRAWLKTGRTCHATSVFVTMLTA